MERERGKSKLENTLVIGAQDRFVIQQLLVPALLQQLVLGQTHQHFPLVSRRFLVVFLGTIRKQVHHVRFFSYFSKL